ncbi:GNAT family N-acetyltransferase [Glycomyces terrestris]|uniref:GNAT family N-acetyltransferase n=1 Tax=Glycomyces terrestris TaxID=2493553 RepID=A0A426V5W2_9ACTN|nr:GNAT family N-acetyltransferase [Glycomyces terrestris]
MRPAEYAGLGELTVGSYEAGGFLIGGLEDGYVPHLRDVAHRAASATVLVAVDGDRVLGGVTIAFPGSPLMELGGDGDAEIRMLAVDPAAGGRGVGSALAAACVERARAEPGTKRIVLCSQQTMTTAHRIYRRLGFEREPSLDWEPVPGVLLWAFSLSL